MPSLRARLANSILPLFGIKKFFSEPDKLEERIAKLRRQKPQRPKTKWHRRLEISEDTSRGFPILTITPKGGHVSGAPHLFYLHGGGYVMDASFVHFDGVAKLCEILGASATLPLYPLAPEVTVNVTLPAMLGLYDELAGEYGASSLSVMGDSAGGGMALALAQALKARGAEMPASLVLYSPWLDATATDPGLVPIESKDNLLAIAGLKACGKLYAGKAEPSDPRVSPLFGSLEQLPPMAVFAGTHDILLVDARRLAKAFSGSDQQRFTYHEYEGMFHIWMLFPIPEGRRALEETAHFIHQHNGSAG